MKLKTHQSTVKKVKISHSKRVKKIKLITKHAGQDHFNARESGNTTRNKRRNVTVAKVDTKTLKNILPYYRYSA